jgi:hypothetical protein
MKISKYFATVEHDDGVVSIGLTASSKEAAIKSICIAENCPQSAVIEVVKAYDI